MDPTHNSGRILVVDDDPATRDLLTAFLTEQGHEVRAAGDGVDALRITLSWRPDLIVLDLLMPKMNGWQFADFYSAQPFRHAPIIAITAGGAQAIYSAENLPLISAVLSKPLQLTDLQDLVDLTLAVGAA